MGGKLLTCNETLSVTPAYIYLVLSRQMCDCATETARHEVNAIHAILIHFLKS